MAPEVEVDVPSTSPELLIPATATVEPSLPISDLLMELPQPTALLAITESSYQPRNFFSSFCIYPIKFNCFLNPFDGSAKAQLSC